MSRIHPHRHPWLIYVVLPLLLILFGLQIGILVSVRPKLSPPPFVPVITPAPN